MCESHRAGRYLLIELFEKMYHGKLQSLVWEAMLVPRLMGTNMAAGNQQKDLEFTLAISKPFFSLLKFHTLTLTLLLHVS